MDISQRNLLELAMSSLPTGLFICDRDGIIRFINDAYANYLRVRPEDAMGRHITDFIPDSGIPAVIASGEPELGAWRSIQGSERKILVNRIPLRDQDGHVIGAFSLTLFDTPEQMQALLQRVDFLDKKVNSYARRIKSALRASHTINSILGNSPAITAFKSYLLRYARTESPVLILGATGTGKELAASAIHMASNRPDGPFVSINCAAIPKELFESEVFGYVPGAFSGAHKDGKIGQIELADQGTLFLDEVGDLPLHAQVKLLRVLESHKSKRLGAVSEREIDFRLLAATNQDLKTCVEKGSFRADLYYRLNVIPLEIPPLRNRREDIIPLALFFLDHFCKKYGRTKVFTKGVFNQMMCYDWPGNVRELKNVVERLLITSSVGTMEIRQVPENLLGEGSVPPPPPEVYPADWESIYQYDPEDFSLKKYMNFCEKQVVAAALKRCGSSYKAAELLKTDQSTIIRKRQKYGIS